MRILQVFFYTVLSIFLMTSGIPNEILSFGMPLAGLLCLVPFYLALSRCKTYREAGLCTSLFLGTVHAASSFWLANFKEFAILTIGASSAFYYVAGWFIGQLLYIPFNITLHPEEELRENAGCRPFNVIIRILYFTAAWTLYEWWKSEGFLAYPWGTVILTSWKWKLLIQIVSLTGTWGISFLFSLFAATAAEVIRSFWRNEHAFRNIFLSSERTVTANAALFTVFLFLASLIYGTYEFYKPRTPVKTLNTVLVQHNADSWEGSEADCILTAERLTEEAIEASDKEPQIVVWSEGFLTYPLPESWWYYDGVPYEYPLQESIRDTGVPYLIGAPYTMDDTGTHFGNCAVLLNPDASIQEHYAKIHLVPFAEGIPFADKPWMKTFMQIVAGFSNGWQAGNEYTIFTVQGSEPVHFSAPVCFEDAFPSVCRQLFLAGSEVFMNITNDSWSLKKSAEYQHYIMSSFRALEFRTTLVRTTNGGYTTVTGPNGTILTDLPLFEEASVLAEVPIFEREITTYAELGDWIPVVAFVILLLLLPYFIFYLQYLSFLHSEHILHDETEYRSN
ncbi:MAG: apolipoprotein N-acyltransferase [Treponema sp.]|nr:apolipoprotein N-acyltransferase [Candidatus Treponema caballi]